MSNKIYDYVASRIVNLYYGCECRQNRIRWTVRDLGVTFNLGHNTAA